jgi:hypothetical protein
MGSDMRFGYAHLLRANKTNETTEVSAANAALSHALVT